jgi:diketogulonate reductase-like aldo/keto reductase
MKLDDPAIRDIRKQTWHAFERLYQEGKCKSIGVSNFMPHHLKQLVEAEWCTIKPMVNQFELHPMLQQREAVAASRGLNIRVEAYSSLARGKAELHTCPVILEAAKAHDVTVGQVLLRWGVQHGYIVIPKSSHPERIEENFNLFGWHLTDPEMVAIDALDGHLRTCWDPTTVVV